MVLFEILEITLEKKVKIEQFRHILEKIEKNIASPP